jgi:hypothetical protein
MAAFAGHVSGRSELLNLCTLFPFPLPFFECSGTTFAKGHPLLTVPVVFPDRFQRRS